jgi:hypothetical protein
LLLDWLCSGREDYREFQRRKSTGDHRRRRALCVWVWIAAASVMAIQPTGQTIVVSLLAGIFLSFAILDDE